MFLTGDPEKDFDLYEAEREKAVNKLPICVECDEPITTDECYEINDELICPECLKNNYRKFTDDYID